MTKEVLWKNTWSVPKHLNMMKIPWNTGWRYVFVALAILHAMRMRHIVNLACPALQ
jgi:hypothetical protein